MKTQLQLVKEFHVAIGEKVAETAELLQNDPRSDQLLAAKLRELIEATRSVQHPGSHLNRRVLMAVEELAEWIEAHVAGDMVEAADALGDRLYVLLGDAVATGLPAEQILAEVHRSNMTKFRADDVTGKGVKTDSFERPRLAAVMNDLQ